MTPQEMITLVTVVISAVLAVAGFFAGRLTGKHTEGKEAGVLASDVGWIKANLEDIKRGQREQAEKAEVQHLEVMTRLSKVEDSAKSAHKRINQMQGQPPRE